MKFCILESYHIQLEPVRQVLPFDWFTTEHLVSGECTLHQITGYKFTGYTFSARSRIFLPSAQSCAALLCCRLGWLFGNYRSIATIKAGNFIYPMMHRLILYHHASERTWSYQFNRDATVEQHWKATCFADETFCTFAMLIFLRFSFYSSKCIFCLVKRSVLPVDID